MAKNKATTVKADSCLQCEGDEMLEVRKHASEAFSIMDLLERTYGTNKTGATIVDYVQALIEAEKDQRRLVAMTRSDAERRVKEVNELANGLRFVSDTTKETYSSGVNLSSKSMTIPLTEIFRMAIHKLQSLATSDRGLLEGRQPHNEKDFMSHFKKGTDDERTRD